MAGFNHFADLANALEPACTEVVSNTAKAGKAHVQEHIQANGQVLSGFMLGSVYTHTPEGSDYTGGGKAFPDVGAPPDKVTAYFAVAATYAGFQNYGTRYLPARPFFEPGVDETARDFESELSKLESYWKAAL